MVINKLVSAAAGAATKLLDQTATNMFGGELVKAKLVVYKTFEGGSLGAPLGSDWDVEFFLNPNQIDTKQDAELHADEGNARTASMKYGGTNPICLTLQDLIFDTYDTRKSVRTEYIDKLEKLVRYYDESHHLPIVTFVWGQFTGSSQHNREYAFYVTSVSVTYTMFLPDATPVRAKVKLGMVQKLTPDTEEKLRSKQSPDHAKLYTVKRGDTLQAIANAEYDDPREWRRIAKTNNIDDPMALRPGMKLLVPPILK